MRLIQTVLCFAAALTSISGDAVAGQQAVVQRVRTVQRVQAVKQRVVVQRQVQIAAVHAPAFVQKVQAVAVVDHCHPAVFEAVVQPHVAPIAAGHYDQPFYQSQRAFFVVRPDDQEVRVKLLERIVEQQAELQRLQSGRAESLKAD
ncbi:MAG: hypothetical protein ACRC1K_21595 [Planctomycetia bacterium]